MSWLDELKPGDNVLVFTPSRGHGTYRQATVEKVQKLHIVADGGKKYRRAGGTSVVKGSPWTPTESIVPFDQGKLDAQNARLGPARAWSELRHWIAGCREVPSHLTAERMSEILAEMRTTPRKDS